MFDRIQMRAIREAAGLTQADLAARIRQAVPGAKTIGLTVSFWELGQQIPSGPFRVGIEKVLAELEKRVVNGGRSRSRRQAGRK